MTDHDLAQPGRSSERLSLALESSYTDGIAHACSPLARCQDGRAVGLAGSVPGEGSPADAGSRPVKGSRPAALSFELAAVVCGHDSTTRQGAADARHDYRVWDLVGGVR